MNALVLAVAFALFAALSHPLLAVAPLLVVGLPAGLMLAATLRHGDPYDVRHKYPPGSHLGGSVSPHE